MREMAKVEFRLNTHFEVKVTHDETLIHSLVLKILWKYFDRVKGSNFQPPRSSNNLDRQCISDTKIYYAHKEYPVINSLQRVKDQMLYLFKCNGNLWGLT